MGDPDRTHDMSQPTQSPLCTSLLLSFFLPQTSDPTTLPSTLSLEEVTALWQQLHKPGQQLLLLSDCAGSGCWVSALQARSLQDQLALGISMQASDSAQTTVHHPPGELGPLVAAGQKLLSFPDPLTRHKGYDPGSQISVSTATCLSQGSDQLVSHDSSIKELGMSCDMRCSLPWERARGRGRPMQMVQLGFQGAGNVV